MNIVVLMGRLTKDPDIRYTNGDNPTAVARYTLAVDRRYTKRNGDGNEQTADFISCVAFGKVAEFAEKYLKKGTKIIITGRIQTGSYKNKDNQTIYTTDVVVNSHEFPESKKTASEQDAALSSASAGNSQGAAPQDSSMYNDGFMDIPDGLDDEELPFN